MKPSPSQSRHKYFLHAKIVRWCTKINKCNIDHTKMGKSCQGDGIVHNWTQKCDLKLDLFTFIRGREEIDWCWQHFDSGKVLPGNMDVGREIRLLWGRRRQDAWEAQEQWPVEEMGGARRRAMNSIGSAPTAFGARGGLQELRLLTHWSPPLLLRRGHQLGVKRPHTVVEVGPGYEGAGVEKYSGVHLSSTSKGCPLIHHMFHNYLRQHLKTPNKLHWSIITSSRTFGTSPVPWITENRQTR